MGHRGHAHGGVPAAVEQARQPDGQPGPATDARPGHYRCLRRVDGQPGRPAVGHGRGQLQQPVRAGPDLGRLQGHRLVERLGQLQQQLVQRDGPGQPCPEGAQGLVRRRALAVHQPVGGLGEPLAGRVVQQRADGRGGHRQQQQGALALARHLAEAEHDQQVDGHDQAAQPGQRHRVGEQAVDPADEPGRSPGGQGEGDEHAHRPHHLRHQMRPPGEHAQGRDHQRSLGDHDHGQPDPLHPLAGRAPGGQEPPVRGTQPGGDGHDAGRHHRPQRQRRTLGPQRQPEPEPGRVADCHRDPPGPAPQPPVGQPDDQVQGHRREQPGRQRPDQGGGRSQRPGRVPVEDPAAEHAGPAESGRGQHDRAQLPLPRPHHQRQPGQRPGHHQPDADQLGRAQAVVPHQQQPAEGETGPDRRQGGDRMRPPFLSRPGGGAERRGSFHGGHHHSDRNTTAGRVAAAARAGRAATRLATRTVAGTATDQHGQGRGDRAGQGVEPLVDQEPGPAAGGDAERHADQHGPRPPGRSPARPPWPGPGRGRTRGS